MQMTEYQKKLVEEHLSCVNYVIRTRIGLTNDPMLSYDDFYQVGCEALCKAAMRYRPQAGPFMPYAKRVVYNGLIDYCRHMGVRYRLQSDVLLDCDNSAMAMLLLSSEAENALSDVDHQDAMRIFQERKAAYTGIAKKGVEAMELQMEGYSVAEIAKMYDTTPNNVNAWISRARKKLKQDADMMSALR